MKRLLLILSIASLFSMPACQRSACPAYDGLSAEMNGAPKAKSKAPKGKTGLYGGKKQPK